MEMRLAGAALAAVVGACALGGGAQRAEAYQIDYTGAAYYGFLDDSGEEDVKVYQYLSYDTVSKTGSLHVQEFYNDFINREFFSTEITDVQLYSVKVDGGYVFGITLTAAGKTNGFDDVDSLGVEGGPFVLQPYAQTIGAMGGDYFSPSIASSGPLTITGLSPVPLPGSVSLFGAAVLALAGVSFVRRKAQA